MNWATKFGEDGYFKVEGALPHDAVDAHVAFVSSIMERHGLRHNSQPSLPDHQRLYREEMRAFHSKHPIALSLSFHPKLVRILDDLFAEAPVLGGSNTGFWEKGDRKAHFDTSVLSTFPDHFVCRVWCALEDINEGSGIFFVVPGSHKYRAQILDDFADEQAATFKSLLDRLAEDRTNVWPEFHRTCFPSLLDRVADRVDADQKLTFAMKKGDVIFFSPNAVHGTMKRQDPSLSRKVMINEYRARSARIFFASERFGSRFRSSDERGFPADLKSTSTPYGLVQDHIEWEMVHPREAR